MVKNIVIFILIAAAAYLAITFFFGRGGEAVNVRQATEEELGSRVSDSSTTPEETQHDTNPMSNTPEDTTQDAAEAADTFTDSESTEASTRNAQDFTTREVLVADEVRLPLSGSAPTEDVKFSIPIEDIRRGCFAQDCIPSVDDPQFVSVDEGRDILADAPNDIGIALSYEGIERFYPFAMLVTREIVNDTVAGDPVLVTYCPLCGTGIVFDRRVDGVPQEFGVSGMLWQSNLLMYNRATNVENRSLWSQVLGEAVVGSHTGTKLKIIPSNITRFRDWAAQYPSGEVLDTGRIGDPYSGNYYDVARNFDPDFDPADSPLDPSAYVYGIEVNGAFKAYPFDALPTGETTDDVNGQTVTITKSESGLVTITDRAGTVIPDIEGFWFSWVAAHPDTQLWQN